MVKFGVSWGSEYFQNYFCETLTCKQNIKSWPFWSKYSIMNTAKFHSINKAHLVFSDLMINDYQAVFSPANP